MMKSMKNNFQEESISKEKKSGQAQPDSLPARASVLTKFISALLGMGLGEPLIKLGANLFSVIAIALVVVMSRSFYQQAGETPNGEDQAQSLIDEAVEVNSIPVSAEAAIEGISRNAQLRTTIPSRPREELSTYLVQDGDILNIRHS